jgi:apolipoprotein D and lipocalin family protein
MPRLNAAPIGLLTLLLTTGCSSMPKPPLATVKKVDLNRFMGDWYVIASIPTSIEEGAHNAVESYRLDDDGTIATTFTFRKGAFDGPEKTYRPRGFVRDDPSNAVWGMRFIWPFKAEYLVVHLDEAYTQTIIGRNARDYVWVMARTPSIPEEDYLRLAKLVGDMGYDVSKLERVPQRWEGAAPPGR